MTSKEILDISVFIQDINEVKTQGKVIKMLMFSGTCTGTMFEGEIMPGGVDIQIVDDDGNGTVCARYMLKGFDCQSNPCKIYIENIGTIDSGEMSTIPHIYTDSEALKWMETASLTAAFSMIDQVFHVKIYKEKVGGQ